MLADFMQKTKDNDSFKYIICLCNLCNFFQDAKWSVKTLASVFKQKKG